MYTIFIPISLAIHIINWIDNQVVKHWPFMISQHAYSIQIEQLLLRTIVAHYLGGLCFFSHKNPIQRKHENHLRKCVKLYLEFKYFVWNGRTYAFQIHSEHYFKITFDVWTLIFQYILKKILFSTRYKTLISRHLYFVHSTDRI